MPYSDKQKQQEFQRNFVQKKKQTNPAWHAELVRRKKQQRKSTQDIIAHIKSTFGCLLCDETNAERLQFHHVLPEMKVATIADMVSNRSKLLALIKELNKCVCVCYSCHKHLDQTIDYLKEDLKKENDISIKDVLELAKIHPQIRLQKSNFIEIIKTVAKYGM